MQFQVYLSILVLGALVGVIAATGTVSEETLEDELVVTLPGGVPIELRRIPAGSFLMGSPDDEEYRDSEEGPLHHVSISEPFYMGKYEVTHAQWRAVTGAIRENAGFDGSNLDGPMQATSWEECKGFIEQLNELGLGHFRLPTEAEWEYACRAGTTTRFFWGDDPDLTEIDEYAWYDENSDGEAHRVGEKKPNPWGLYDMTGNVYEWCQDWYGPYSAEAQTDPKGPKKGIHKVFRGGEWFNPAENCRSAFRGGFTKDNWLYFGGLRLVLELPE